jgi:hypothetical protein
VANRFSPFSAILSAPVRVVADRIVPASAAPRGVEDLDLRWFDRILGLSQGSVRSCEVRDIDHGTSLRVRVEVLHDGGSTTLFIKQTPTRIAARTFNLISRLCEHEVYFYGHRAAETGCAPKALAAQWHPATGRSTLVLPDLGADGFTFVDIAQTCSSDQAARAVEAMATLHRTFWGAKRFDPRRQYLPANMMSSWGNPLLCRYLGGTPERLEEHLPTGFAAQARIIRDRAADMTALFNSFDQSFVHNDSHQGNVAFRADRAVLVDWQVCAVGSAIKDFAYFLATADTKLRRAHERDLLALYLAALSAGDGPVIGWDDAWHAYRVLAVTGYIAAAVTSLFGDRLQNADNVRTGLLRAATAVVDLDSFSAVGAALTN